jgi:hypothetical protein
LAGHERKVLCSILIVSSDDAPALQIALVDALRGIPTAELIVAEIAHGAAIGFLGDPHDALSAGLALAQHIPARIALDIGLATSGEASSITVESLAIAGDVLHLAQAGQLLASAAFHDLVTRLTPPRAALFAASPSPGVYRISQDAPSSAGSAKIFDAGSNLMLSGSTRDEIEQALRHLTSQGASIVSPPTLVGNRWMGSATHPSGPIREATVEKAGLMHIVTGPTRLAVEEKVRELLNVGARQVSEIEQLEGTWTAVCDVGGRSRKE